MPAPRKTVLPTPSLYEGYGLGERASVVSYSRRTLVHEVTHMFMHDLIPHLPMWMIEGAAEYVEKMPATEIEFMPGKSELNLKFSARDYTRSENSVTPPSFGELMSWTNRDWIAFCRKSRKHQSAAHYTSYLLFAYYTLHQPDLLNTYLDQVRRVQASGFPSTAANVRDLTDILTPANQLLDANTWKRENRLLVVLGPMKPKSVSQAVLEETERAQRNAGVFRRDVSTIGNVEGLLPE